MAEPEKMVVLAAVIGAHGISGEVRLKLFTDDLARYPALVAGDRTLTLKSVRPGSNGAVVWPFWIEAAPPGIVVEGVGAPSIRM